MSKQRKGEGRMARNVLGPVAAASVVLAMVAGCGSSGGAAKAAGAARSAVTESKAASASPTASAASDSSAKPLTKAQLTKALLDQGDLKGYGVQVASSPDTPGIPIDADEDVCAAVSMMMLFSLSADPEARVARTVSATSGDTVGTATSVLLSSYQEADAKQGMADLKPSVEGCPDGFEVDADLKVSAVKPLDAPHAGDEAVSFRLSGGILGKDTRPLTPSYAPAPRSPCSSPST